MLEVLHMYHDMCIKPVFRVHVGTNVYPKSPIRVHVDI